MTKNEESWPSRQWQIGSISNIGPGNRAVGLIEHGSTADGAPLQTPVHLLVGAEVGPILYIQAAVHGVTNVMKHLGMLAGEIVPADRPQITLLGSHQDGVRATQGGFWQPKIQPGDTVKAGQIIGETYSIRTFEIVETQYAPAAGFVLGIADVPIVNIGDRVANICRTE